MEKFDEYAFANWVHDKVGYSIRKHSALHETEEDIYLKISDRVNDLSAMELVCLLGEYLTMEKSP